MAIDGNTTCAVPGCGAPISEPNNLCKEHRLPGLSVRVDGSTMVITAWYAEHGDEAGLILLNDWAPGAHFGGGAGFEGSLAAKHYQQKMIDFYMISDHVRHASRSRRCVATRRNLNDERAAILSGWPRRRRT